MSTAEVNVESAITPVTADQLLVEHRDERCDLIDGRVVFMAPAGFGHGSVESRITHFLHEYVEKHMLGIVVSGDSGFVLARNPDTVLGPDVAFVTRERLDQVGVPDEYFPGAPTLAVEVVSPSDKAERVNDKAVRWLEAGTRVVWIVYPKNQTVTVYHSAKEAKLLSADDTLDGGGVLPGFSVKVAELFAGLK